MDIRKLETVGEYLEAENLQKIVWHFPDREIVSLNELAVLQKHGGHIFGAFDDGKMIAFCYGFPAYSDGETYHYSQMLGVIPGCQDSGIGHAMKLKQREFVLKQGLDRVVWTFDPLQSRNAYLNVEKLGCVIREYIENLYPQSDTQFSRGLGSDRFSAEWWIASRRVKDRIQGRRKAHDLGEYTAVVETKATDRGWREPVRLAAKGGGKRLSVEIPDDIDALKTADLALAQKWRQATRGAFQACFKRGYVINGFASEAETGRRRSFYLLEKGYRVR